LELFYVFLEFFNFILQVNPLQNGLIGVIFNLR